jgi:integrase
MADLSSKAKRAKLKPGTYWNSISKTLSLGYRKGVRGARWWAREFVGLADGETRGTPYRRTSLADTNDGARLADGKYVLDHEQAIQAAITWSTKPTQRSLRGMSIGNVVDAYLRHYETESSDETLSNKAIAEKWVSDEFRDIRIADMTTYHLQVWRDNLVLEGKVSKATANRIWTVMRAALNYGFEKMGLADADRWKRIKPYGGTNMPRADYLTPAQAIALLDAMPADFRQLALGALYTGGRYRELRMMQVKHVNLRDVQVEFVFTKGRHGGKRREVPLSAEGIAHFGLLVEGLDRDALVFRKADGEPWGKSQQVRRMKDAATAAKLPHLNRFHMLRHTYASVLAQAGMPMRSIQYLLGHADMRITVQHYAHLQPDHVATEIKTHLPSFAALSSAAVH